MTTLNVAADVAVLVLAQEVAALAASAILFFAFGISLLASVWGIEAALRYTRERYSGATYGLRVRYAVASTMFGAGVVSSTAVIVIGVLNR